MLWQVPPSIRLVKSEPVSCGLSHESNPWYERRNVIDKGIVMEIWVALHTLGSV